jgi:uncharacterized SAM-binding protein YcdF (DUF218 family)
MEILPSSYVLYKLAKYAVFPLTWACGSLIVAAVLALLPYSPRRQWIVRLFAWLGLFLLVASSSPITATVLTGTLEGWYPPFDTTRSATFDAIVVLGGGASGKGSLRPVDELGDLSARRATCGVDLYLRGFARKLVFSGGDGSISGKGPKEAVEMKRWAMRLGVPEEAITIEDQSRNTYENAVHTQRILGNATVLLVSSADHMLRAMALFRKAGVNPTAAPCGYHVKDHPSQYLRELTLFKLLPDAAALTRTTYSMNELVGTLVYWVTGKV